jgi:hypothetical protein
MYEEIGYICLTAVIGTLSGVLATWTLGKRMISDDAIMNKLAMILENVTKDEGLQKHVYSIGVLLGSGIAKGTGIQGGGKFKFTDIIGQGIAAWFGGKLSPGAPAEQKSVDGLNPPPESSPGPDDKRALAKKW